MTFPIRQPLIRTSAFAVASLVCGILSIILCLGPITGIPAIICGHKGLSETKRGGGYVTGSGMAVAGLVMGYVSLVLTLIAAVILVLQLVFGVVLVGSVFHQVDTHTQCMAIADAVKSYQREYGKPPLATNQDATFGEDNARLFNVLRGVDGPEAEENPKKIQFFHVEDNALPFGKGSRFDAHGTLRDPWGRAYRVRIDGDGDGQVANPFTKNGGPNPLREPVIVWSLGSDWIPGNEESDGQGKPTSWSAEPKAPPEKNNSTPIEPPE